MFVGGTATNLLKLLRRAGNPDRDDRLDRAALESVRDIVAATPAEMLAATYGLREARIRLLAAGAAIIETILDRVGMEFGRVVDTGIREGAIIAADRAGDELARSARGAGPRLDRLTARFSRPDRPRESRSPVPQNRAPLRTGCRSGHRQPADRESHRSCPGRVARPGHDRTDDRRGPSTADVRGVNVPRTAGSSRA